jgi:CRISPR-associated endonuclease/helicase Cas3
MSFGIEQFPVYFREMNDGHDPFPWQERLARQVFENGWPAVLDLPTASGKTAVLDIAIFHLALEAAAAQRRAPLRIAFVVDRRLIVDQAQERAKRIQCLLKQRKGIAGEVASALKSISGEEPLVVNVLRGGLPRESDWARTPVQPTILLSTVDQVGSRLLFRGYGVSKSMRPMHAGLLGSDCLIFLDEAHLSEPFRQSLDWVKRWRGENMGPWGFVTLSATPGESDAPPYRLEEADREHPILGARLKASKPAELREISAENRAQNYAVAARELQEHDGIDRVLVVVNRVDLARGIFEQLGEENAILLTGRIREIDRDEIVHKLMSRFRSGEKFFAVATQCIEAGVDLDFDGLVTQIAPIDALRQRFGRLNRMGRLIDTKAIIMATREEVSKKPDAIYGDSLKKTWDALREIAISEKKKFLVDFGALVFPEKFDKAKLQECASNRLNAPIMPPAYVELWSSTNPPPAVEPEVALFLHGPERASADVEIVWRADLIEPTDEFAKMLPLMPPRSGETLAVPLWKVRDWLGGKQAADIGDFEGALDHDSNEFVRGKPSLKWSDGEAKRVWPHEIRPGDVIVVPASYGGCDPSGQWTGRSGEAVIDRGFEAAAKLRRAEIAIRVHPALLGEDLWAEIRPGIEANQNDATALFEDLRTLENAPFYEEINAIRTRPVAVTFYDESDPLRGFVLTGRRRGRGYASTEDDRTASIGKEISLADHTRDVVKKTEQFSAGIPNPVRRALLLAAKFHDLGKADGRFQAWLHDGTDDRKILAKSRHYTSPPPALRSGWRHEALSVRIATGDDEFCAAEIEVQELALWLIGTHHGRGRPFFPHDDEMDDRAREIDGPDGEKIMLDASPGPQRLDFDWNGLDWASLFAKLQQRYGAWELARYESILRLADHRASEEEEENAEGTSAQGTGA